MTLKEAADGVADAARLVEERRADVDALRESLKAAEQALRDAEGQERGAQTNLAIAAGGRYWDNESGSFKIAEKAS